MVTVAPSSAHTPSEVDTESGTADGKELDAGALFVLKSKGKRNFHGCFFWGANLQLMKKQKIMRKGVLIFVIMIYY